MSRPSEEELLREQIERTKVLVVQITQLLSGASDADARSSLAVALAQRCVANEYPDRSFLECIDAMLAIFRDLSNAKYRNENKEVS